MQIKKILYIILSLCLLTGTIVLCSLRWQAWFDKIENLQIDGDTICSPFYCFADDSIPYFEKQDTVWYNTKQPDSLVILVLGDVQNTIPHSLWDTIYERHPNIDCYAQLGNLFSGNRNYEMQMLLNEINGTAFDSLPIICTAGNKDYTQHLIKHLGATWSTLFNNPQNGPTSFLGTTFFIDFPQLRLIMIDTYGMQWLHDYTRANTWLKQTIKTAGNRFVTVMMHQPVYSCSVGCQNYAVAATFMRPLKDVDLVLSGHDHNYARRLPFINLNSSQIYDLHNVDHRFDKIGTEPVYALLTITNKILIVEVFQLNNGNKYDEIKVVRSTSQSEYTDNGNLIPEIVLLPKEYKDKNTVRVRRFTKRLEERQALLNRTTP